MDHTEESKVKYVIQTEIKIMAMNFRRYHKKKKRAKQKTNEKMHYLEILPSEKYYHSKHLLPYLDKFLA